MIEMNVYATFVRQICRFQLWEDHNKNYLSADSSNSKAAIFYFLPVPKKLV